MEADFNVDAAIDIEEQLDHYFIRRKPYDQVTSHNKKIEENAPLLLRHALNSVCDAECFGVFKYSDGTHTLYFRSCIFYVNVTAILNHNDSYYKYIMDDMTGAAEMSIYRNKSQLESLTRMQDEATVMGRRSTALNREALSASLLRLLSKTKEYLDASNIALGTQLIVKGKPSMYRGKLGFNVYSFCKDNGISREMEIAFRDYQIDWYTRKMKTH